MLVCAVVLLACRDPSALSGTALYVTVEFDPALMLTQVRVGGTVEGGRAFGPQVLPERTDRLLHSGETLRVLLEDAPDGAQAQVYVEGLRDKNTVARGEGSAKVRTGYEVDVTLRLEPRDPEGGFCPECAGCCQDGLCTPSTFNTCGSGGLACMPCDQYRADGCDVRGVCVCGLGPACGINADRCLYGRCWCGRGRACGPGQACVNGTCQCTPDSCKEGCCWGNTCEPGTAKDRCGTGGAACLQCANLCTPQGTCG